MPNFKPTDASPPSPPTPEIAAPAPQRDGEMRIGRLAAEGSVWMIGATGAAKAAGLACQLVLAWFLTKKDYGVYAIAVSLASFLSVLRDGGLSMVLEQKGARFHLFAGPAFWMMMAMNCATGLVIALVAAPAAASFRLPELTGVIELFAATIPLSVVPSILSVRLMVDLRFRTLGVIQIVSAFSRNLLMLIFAWQGFGARSLLMPILITSITDSLMFWYATRCSPWTLAPQWRTWPVLFADGRWLLLGTFSISMGNNGAYLILGAFLPSELVGTYFFAYQIVVQLGVLLSDNFFQVLAPSFVRLREEVPRLRAAVRQALSVVVLVGAAASLSIALIYEPVDRLLWRGKWAAATPAILILAITWPASAGVSVLRAVQIATGHFKLWGVLTLTTALLCIAGTALGARLGATPASAALGFGIAVVIGSAFSTAFALTAVGVRAADAVSTILRPWLVIVGAAMFGRWAGSLVDSDWINLLVSVSSCGIVGYLGLRWFAADSLRLVQRSVLQVLRGAVFPALRLKDRAA